MSLLFCGDEAHIFLVDILQCLTVNVDKKNWNIRFMFVTILYMNEWWMLKLSDGKVATQLAKDSDIHVITGLLKLYLRELPESLFTDALYPSLVTGMGTVHILLTAFTTRSSATAEKQCVSCPRGGG